MNERETEVEVVALVVSKENIRQDSLQNCEPIHQAGAQKDLRLCPQNESMISEGDNSSDSDDLNISTERSSTNDSYSYCHTRSGDKNTNATVISERSPSYIERSTDHYCEEELPSYEDRNQVYQENKQINFEDSNCYADQSTKEFSVYSNEHVYQRTDKVLLDQSGKCLNYETDKTNKIVEPSSPNKSKLNTVYIHSNGQSYFQMTNVAIESQESYQQIKYKYFEVDNNHRSITSEQHEVISHREYTHQEHGYVLQEKGDPCHNKYYNYEPENEKIYKDEIISNEMNSGNYNCSYQYIEGRLYNGEEETPPEHNYQLPSYNSQQNSKNKTFIIDGKESSEYRDTFKRKYSSQEEENSCEENSCPKVVTSAVDLRIMRPFRQTPSSDKQLSVPHVSGDIYPDKESRENASLSESIVANNTTSSSSSDVFFNQTCNEEVHNITSQPKSFHYNIFGTKLPQNNEKWDAATNTDNIQGEDKECQTNFIELRDVAVQTDLENNKVIPFSLFKNIQSEIVKHLCPICNKVYISKSSFDRHLRTHEKGANILSDLKLTSKTKLQICKRPDRNAHLKTQKPIIIQIPRSVFQCDMCENIFPNEMEKDNHSCSYNPFPLNKCPECHLKFYTTGGLNEHIGICHKKESTYYCIFCGKSFSAGYSFHLHLDEHLSSQ